METETSQVPCLAAVVIQLKIIEDHNVVVVVGTKFSCGLDIDMVTFLQFLHHWELGDVKAIIRLENENIKIWKNVLRRPLLKY